MASRGQFSTRAGFILAAAGSAVGLGNVWGFPTNAAENGGGAFVLMYFILAFCLAYPALMAELIIGRHAQANMVTALVSISNSPVSRLAGRLSGFAGVVAASLILSFYSIVAGWMIAFMVQPLLSLAGMTAEVKWLTESGVARNIVFCAVFMGMTCLLISAGVEKGIEKWSTRLMPTLLALLIALIFYVLTREGAMEGLQIYLIPDFSQITKPSLVVGAMGQAFFSLSLGVGTMLIYGSYMKKTENLPKMGVIVTLVDSSIAFLAGLLILPAMFVARENGISINNPDGSLIAGPDLIFQVLPSLFGSMGGIGLFIAFAFFALMTIAALTSSISMLEVPVAFTIEKTGRSRKPVSLFTSAVIFLISVMIILNFELLFGMVVTLTTEYAQPLLGLMLCIFAAWVWHRDNLLGELKQGNEQIESGLFWRVWPGYVRFVCPLLIIAIFAQTIFG